jgi:diguanylate cyclase (GGDEF)-like protein
MISLKKFLDSDEGRGRPADKVNGDFTALDAIGAYRSALAEMGNCSLEACPGLGSGLKEGLDTLGRKLLADVDCATLRMAEAGVRDQLKDWGQQTARHYLQKSDEVRDLLIVMARMAESVGDRDERCAGQIKAVTASLTEIASLEDLTEIRASIVRSAEDLKTSIDRMASEGKAAMDSLRAQVSAYEAKLEKAEQLAFRDALTGVRSRLCIERHIERQIAEGALFCVGVVDIDCFKQVNDEYGHLIGDEILIQFAKELSSACRTNDVVGRWGGDEFIVVLAGSFEEATAQSARVSKWVCGNYTIERKPVPLKLTINASIGVAEIIRGETMQELLARADSVMYAQKGKEKVSSCTGRQELRRV